VLSGIYDEEMIQSHMSAMSAVYAAGGEDEPVKKVFAKERLSDQALMIFHAALQNIRQCLPIALESQGSDNTSSDPIEELQTLIHSHEHFSTLAQIMPKPMTTSSTGKCSILSSKEKKNDPASKVSKRLQTVRHLAKYEIALFEAMEYMMKKYHSLHSKQ
jgi:hypothetical protein